MNFKIGGLYIELGADTKDFDGKVDKAEKKTSDLAKEMKEGVRTAAKWGAAMAAAAAVGLGKIIADSLKAVDAQAKMAKQLGGTIKGLKALEIAGGHAGVPIEVMKEAMAALNKQLLEAETGSSTVSIAFKQLGIDAGALADMDVDERLAVVADAIHTMGLNATDTAGFLRAMGLDQKELIPLMIDGGDAIRDAAKFVEDYGLALSEVDAAKVELANDAWNDALEIIKSAKNFIAVEFAPILKMISEKLIEAAKNGRTIGSGIRAGVEIAYKSFLVIIDAVAIIRRAFEVVANVGAAAFAALASGAYGLGAALLKGPVMALEKLLDGLDAAGRAYTKLANLVQYYDWATGSDIVNKPADKEWEAVSRSWLNGMKGVQEGLEDSEVLLDQTAQNLWDSVAEIISQPLPSNSFRLPDISGLPSDTGDDGAGDGGGGLSPFEAVKEAKEEEKKFYEEYYANLQNMALSHQEAMYQVEQHGLRARLSMQKMALWQQLEDASSAQSRAIQMTGDNLKTIFSESKEMAIAAGLLNAYQAIMSAYRLGTELGGPGLGTAMAGIAGAAQFATLSKIQNTNIGSASAGGAPVASPSGGGAGGGGAGGDPRFVGQNGGIAKINIVGSDNASFSGAQVRDLMSQINQQLDKGWKLQVV